MKILFNNESKKRSKMIIVALTLVLFLVYVLSYSAARFNQVLIHQTTYTLNSSNMAVIDAHHVIRGDLLTQNSFEVLLVETAVIAYKPIATIEVAYWQLVQPPGSDFHNLTAPNDF